MMRLPLTVIAKIFPFTFRTVLPAPQPLPHTTCRSEAKASTTCTKFGSISDGGWSFAGFFALGLDSFDFDLGLPIFNRRDPSLPRESWPSCASPCQSRGYHCSGQDFSARA